MKSHFVRLILATFTFACAFAAAASIQTAVPSAHAAIQLTATLKPCPTPQPPVFSADPVLPSTNLLTQTLFVRGNFGWVRVQGPGGVVASDKSVAGKFALTVPLVAGPNALVVSADQTWQFANGCPVFSLPVPFTVTIDATSAPLPSPPNCPPFPLPLLRVSQSSNIYGGTMNLSVLDSGFEWVRVDGSRYPATSTGRLFQDAHRFDLFLKEGENNVQVTIQEPDRVVGACVYPVRQFTTGVDYLGTPLSATFKSGMGSFFDEPLVTPIVTQTNSFVQDVHVSMLSADALTISVRGPAGNALFPGRRNGANWTTPIDLRAAGATSAGASTYSVTVISHAPRFAGIPERTITSTVDFSGNPLRVNLGPANCAARPIQPVKANPVVSTTQSFTLRMTGEKSDATTRVLLLSPRGVTTATFPTRFSWQADVPLAARTVNTVTAVGIDAADTLCEQRVQTILDTQGQPLRVEQIPKHVYFFPLLGL